MERDPFKDLRKNIAKIELRAERIELARLLESARELSDCTAAEAIEGAIRRSVTALLQCKIFAAAPAVPDLPSADLLIKAAIAYRRSSGTNP